MISGDTEHTVSLIIAVLSHVTITSSIFKPGSYFYIFWCPKYLHNWSSTVDDNLIERISTEMDLFVKDDFTLQKMEFVGLLLPQSVSFIVLLCKFGVF